MSDHLSIHEKHPVKYIGMQSETELDWEPGDWYFRKDSHQALRKLLYLSISIYSSPVNNYILTE